MALDKYETSVGSAFSIFSSSLHSSMFGFNSTSKDPLKHNNEQYGILQFQHLYFDVTLMQRAYRVD